MEKAVCVRFVCFHSNILTIHYSWMLSHCHARRIANTATPTLQTTLLTSSRTNAVQAQARGFAHFTSFSTPRRTISSPSVCQLSSNTPAPTMPTTPASESTLLMPILSNLMAFSIPATILTKTEKAAREAKDHMHDLCTVRNEVHRYKENPLFQKMFSESRPSRPLGCKFK